MAFNLYYSSGLNLLAMASSLLAMAFNLLATSDGLQPIL